MTTAPSRPLADGAPAPAGLRPSAAAWTRSRASPWTDTSCGSPAGCGSAPSAWPGSPAASAAPAGSHPPASPARRRRPALRPGHAAVRQRGEFPGGCLLGGPLPAPRPVPGPIDPQPIDGWAFSISHRYCPDCLAGDGSPVQQQYGGPWQKIWHLPATSTCPRHQRFLREGCPQPHPGSQAIWRPPGWLLIAFPSAVGLHPAQCRRPLGIGGHRSACGMRLDEPDGDRLPRPSQGILDAQQALLALLGPQYPAGDAARAFTDLRVISALLCRSWPLGQDLMDSRLAAAVSEHVRQAQHRIPPGPGPAARQPPRNRRAADRSRCGQGQRRPARHPGTPRAARRCGHPCPGLDTGPRPAPVRMLTSPARSCRAAGRGPEACPRHLENSAANQHPLCTCRGGNHRDQVATVAIRLSGDGLMPGKNVSSL